MRPRRSHRITVGALAVAVALFLVYAVGRSAPPPKLAPSPEGGRIGTGPTQSAQARPPEGAMEIPFASPHAHAVETPSAPDAWGGPRTGKEATLSDRVVKYEIAATLDPKAHTLDGQEKLTWRNRSDRTVKSIFLHLYLNAFEGTKSTFFTERIERGFSFRSGADVKKGEWGHIELKKVQQDGRDVPWTFVHPDGGADTDHTVVRFDLPTPVAPGGSAVVDIAFHDQLPRVIARTGWFGTFHMIGQWFPKVGVLELPGERGATAPRWNVHEFHLHSEFYADWGEYDVRMTVPKSFQVASAGEEQGAPVEKDGLVTHHFVQGDIHDFAWMAVDNFAPPLEGSVDVPGGQHVTVKVFYAPEHQASAAPALKATIDSIKWFSETLGPYPYKTSTCICPPNNAGEAAGMEYQTIFTSEGYTAVEPGTLTEMLLDFVTIHEFGHGYFYGLLASNEFEEPLLDEGLNEYWDMRMLRARKQDVHLTTPFLKKLGIDPVFTAFAMERAGGALDPHPADPIGQNAWDRLSSESYGQVYSRTATVFHDLEERLGHDVTERAFKAYYARWHFRHPSTADLREALAETSGQRAVVEQAFLQNVYNVNNVDDRIADVVSEREKPEPGTRLVDGKWIEESQEEVDKRIDQEEKSWKKAHPDAKHGEGPYPYRSIVTVRRDGVQVPQTLSVEFEDGSKATEKWDDDRLWHRFVFKKPVKVKSARLDPEGRFYLDSNKLNDGHTREPDHAASRRWAGDVSAIAEVLYSILETL
ncbi:MAG: peptidase [Myxococcales bacterium]|nr:peptidase [Myxococcales bacterium]